MVIDLSALEDRILRVERELDLSGSRIDSGDLLAVLEAKVVGEARQGQRGVEFRARMTGRLRLQCGRCLEPYEAPLKSDFRLLVVPEPPEAGPEGEEGHELDEDDLDLFEAPGGKVDLAAVALEQILLNLPLKPVCRPDCQGLCPTCGGNRNRIECGCSRDDPDPRLAPLLDWKKRLDGS